VRQLRDFAVGAIIALLIATAAFVAVRNRELAAKQVDLAQRSAHAVAEGRPPMPNVHTVLVEPAVPSAKHAFLSRRWVMEDGRCRTLGAGKSPDDKLFYDAAARHDRELRTPGSGTPYFAE